MQKNDTRINFKPFSTIYVTYNLSSSISIFFFKRDTKNKQLCCKPLTFITGDVAGFGMNQSHSNSAHCTHLFQFKAHGLTVNQIQLFLLAFPEIFTWWVTSYSTSHGPAENHSIRGISFFKCISQEKGTKSFGKHSIQSRHAIRTGRGTRDDVTHHFDTYKISLAALALVKKSAGDFLQYICRGDRSPFTDQLWGTLTVLPPLLPSAEKFHDPICFSRFTTQRWN